MYFSDFLERLNYIMELINLMTLCDAPDIFCSGREEKETEEVSSVTNNCFFRNESLMLSDKGDSILSTGDFLNKSENNAGISETNRNLFITDLYSADTQNLCENYKSLLYDSNALKNFDGINNYAFAISSAAGGENSLLESFCKKEGNTWDSIYFGENSEGAEILANTALYSNELRSAEGDREVLEKLLYKDAAINSFVYKSRDRADSFGEAFNFYREESFEEERERENADKCHELLMYHKLDSAIRESENIVGKCRESAEVYNTYINQMYGLWDSTAAENRTTAIESIVENGAVQSKWESTARELTEKEAVQLINDNSSADMKTFLRESLHRENIQNKGNVNVNVDFKAYAEVKNDYDTEKFAQVFARYLESQLESCAEGLHY